MWVEGSSDTALNNSPQMSIPLVLQVLHFHGLHLSTFDQSASAGGTADVSVDKVTLI